MNRYFPSNNRGSAMICLISVMLAMSVLSASMLNLTTTATMGDVSSNYLERAYFMAEAGANYALPLIREDIEADGEFDDDETIDGKTFTLDSGNHEEGWFTIRVDDSGTATLLTVTGGSGTGAETKLVYSLDKTVTAGTGIFQDAVFGGDELTLAFNATINGDVCTNASEIEMTGEAVINGDLTTNADVDPEVPTFSCEDCTATRTISEDEIWSGGTLDYSNLTIDEGTTITIEGDVILYAASGMLVKEDVTFNFKEGATLTIYADGTDASPEHPGIFSLIFLEGFSVTTESGEEPDPANFIIYGTANAGIIRVGNDADFYGGIYAPTTKVIMRRRINFTGAVTGNTTSVGKDSTVTWIEDMASVTMAGSGSSCAGATLADPVQYFTSGDGT